MNKLISAFLLTWALTLAAAPARAGQSQSSPPPAGIKMRAVNIWSDGTRLSGNVFHPEGLKPSDRLPALILCHGWGGLREHLNRDYAPRFAAAGYVVLTFDYRGWGDSDSRLVLKEPMPALDQKGEATVRVQAIRELVDPFDQVEDITSALDFIEGEPGVDPERIALWGTSYGGGHVLYVAARDPRVKCIVSQVGSMDSGAIAEHPAYTESRRNAHREAIRRARGEGVDPVPQGVDKVPNLRGTPFISRMVKYRPVELAPQLKVPFLIIDAEKEELFDIKFHGALVYERVKKNVPAKYHVIPGIRHYGIYTTARKEATDMAIEWLDRHLKKGNKSQS
ncbi:MAG TPA: alpha/beta fold hydrolase [Blastocatellia bacterium]|nr:alpha/beta fold hydrolase [Blastocatellia bacterium]